MLKFNNDHILSGYIKQVLSSFNLPKYKIYTKEQQQYHDWAEKYNAALPDKTKCVPTEINVIGTVTKAKDKNHMRYVHYIKDNKIQYCIIHTASDQPDVFEWVDTTKYYIYNQFIPNITTKLYNSGNIYDYHTHEYLGNYLRFIRDYLDIDLMPLYNCFSNRVCTALDYSSYADEEEVQYNIPFTTKNTNYKIYMLPVKLFKKYTIAIDASAGAEICCGIFGKYQDTRKKLMAIPKLTYKKYNNLIFNQPVVYDLLTTLSDEIKPDSESELAQNEQDLKMFIKLPATNDSSIVVLEGDYTHYNDSKLAFRPTKWETKNGWTTNEKFYLDSSTPEDNFGNTNDRYLANITGTKLLYIKENNAWVKIASFSSTAAVYIGKDLPNLQTTERYGIEHDNNIVNSYDLFIKSDGDGTWSRASSGTLYIANNNLCRTQNYTITNFNLEDIIYSESSEKDTAGRFKIIDTISQDFSTFKPITALQLLRTNTRTQYPFADRLIEYLVDNAITTTEENIDNIKRVQKTINLNTKYPDEYSKIWNNDKQQFEIKNGWVLKNLQVNTDGLWENQMRPLLYDKFNQTVAANINDINHDIFGYIDKDIEKYYRANTGEITPDNKNKIYTTISSIDLYTDKDGLYSDLGEDRD